MHQLTTFSPSLCFVAEFYLRFTHCSTTEPLHFGEYSRVVGFAVA